MESWGKLCSILLKTLLGFRVTHNNNDHAPDSDLIAKRRHRIRARLDEFIIFHFPLALLIPFLHPFANREDATFQKEELNFSIGIRKISLLSSTNIHCSSSICKRSFWWLWLTIILLFRICATGINFQSTFSFLNQRAVNAETLPLRRG